MKPKIGPYGQGIGGPVQITGNPNAPSFDPATANDRDMQIKGIIHSEAINNWERDFLLSIYGIERMTPKQTKTFIRIKMKAKEVP